MYKQARIFALLVAAVMLVSLIGCGQSTENPTEQTKAQETTQAQTTTAAQPSETKPEPITLKVMVKDGIPWSNGIQDDPVAKEIERSTGITVDWINLMNVSDVPNYLRTLLASGDLPDIMPNAGLAMIDYYNADAVLPMDEYLDSHGKNMLKNAGELLKLNRTLAKDNDGKLYFITTGYNDRGIAYDSVQMVPHIRYDLYKAIGSPSIATEDELLNALKLMTEKYPKADDGKKAYGMALWFGDSWSWLMVEKVYMGSEGWQGVDEFNSIRQSTGFDKKYQFLFNTEDAKYKGLRFFNKAWNMGLMDPDTAVLKWAQYMEKAQAGRYYYSTDPWSGKDFYNPEAVKKNQPEKGFMPMFDWAKNSPSLSVFQTRDAGDNTYFITKACKTPERAMDLLDFYYSEDGVRLLLNGLEGQQYEVVDGKPKLTASYNDLRKKDNNAAIISTGVKKYLLYGLGATVEDPKYPGRVFDYTIDQTESPKTYSALEKAYCADQGISFITEKFLKHSDPYYSNLVAFMKPVIPEDFAKIRNDLNQLFAIDFFKVISAKNFDQAMEELKKKALALKFQEYTDWSYKAYDETRAKLGVTKP